VNRKKWNGKRPIKDPDLKKHEDPLDNIIYIEDEKNRIDCSFQSPILMHRILKNLEKYKKYDKTEVEYIDYYPYKSEERPVRVDILLPLGLLTIKSKKRKNERAVVSIG